eukprot:CAMPEP_0171092646 /NCGR_PEP_ID=MMETSP0766_2-20121228/36709_1 /TAXON_ID=439317 /ORGANISM="Gambierdiscus australes, Strain CAWD 149" /LENGTH=320 /DNA_ID=CAMNT_0011550929 /DNA_START=47 /DNA_END=1009 /DNA_ORIENTATION=+
MALRILGLLGLNAPACALMSSPRFSMGQSPMGMLGPKNVLPTLSAGPASMGMGMDLNNPMQEVAIAFNATVATFRNPETVAALKRFHLLEGELTDNISTRIVSRVAQLEEEMRNGGGPQLLAQALLDYEQEMRVFGQAAPVIVEETKAALPPGSVVHPEEQLDSGPMMLQLNMTFNNVSLAALQEDAASNISTVAERCKHLTPVVTRMRFLMWDIASFSSKEASFLSGVHEVETSPIVMFAPDIMPKFKDFAINTSLRIVHLTRSFALAIGNVTDFVMMNAEKELGCSVLEKSRAGPRQQGLGLLTGLALVAAVVLGFAY